LEPKSKTDKWKILKTKKNSKSLQYLLIKKFDNVIDYKNIKLLKAFNEIWKIRPRRKTRISVQKTARCSKSNCKSRAGLIPFTCDVKI
jgi:ribosomal protein S18